jgi:hypothetical protein
MAAECTRKALEAMAHVLEWEFSKALQFHIQYLKIVPKTGLDWLLSHGLAAGQQGCVSSTW